MVNSQIFQRSLTQTLANFAHMTGGEYRTPRRTHIFFSLVVSRSITHTCVWLKGLMTLKSQELCVVSLRIRKTSSSIMFHSTLLGVLDTFSSFGSSPSQTTPAAQPMTGISSALLR